jgi:L-amino acid N-acyltransferase YncA
MDYIIREAREADAAGMVAVLNPIIQTGRYTVMAEPVSVADQRTFIRGFPERGIFHVAVTRNGDLVGLQDVMPLSGEPGVFDHVGAISTFVALDARSQGIGTRLTNETIEAAKAQGFIKLWATIRGDNPEAIAFYQSQGFHIIGTAERHARVHGTYIDEVFAERFIQPHQ